MPVPQSSIVNRQSSIRITLIVAMSRNRVIGRNNALPWRMPADMAHFKKLTMDHAVIMGRRTFESLGSKPLPGRTNIVITRDRAFQPAHAHVAHDLDEALRLAVQADHASHHKNEVFILGGTEIFKLALPMADRIYLTLIEADFDGDATFPTIDGHQWNIAHDESHHADARNPHPWRFQLLERVRAS